jgi:hypothetical protein
VATRRAATTTTTALGLHASAVPQAMTRRPLVELVDVGSDAGEARLGDAVAGGAPRRGRTRRDEPAADGETR